MKNLIRILFHRVTYIVVFMLLQLFLLVSMLSFFREYFVYFYSLSVLLSACIVLGIINNNDNPAYKIAWIIPVMLLPLFGSMFYLMFSHSGLTKSEKAGMTRILLRIQEAEHPDPEIPAALETCSLSAAAQSRYITGYSYCPPCQNSETTYLPMGEIAFEQMKEAFERAERYIFLEYFIIQPGVMWDSILEILQRKVAQGVDVRVIYDDMGCLFTLPWRYDHKLEAQGIHCHVFNPFRPVLSSRFNNRSHRKIASVDGHTAFTGGLNLADEYINAYQKHGHWKDTAIMVQGEAAWYLTAMFLSMWDYLDGAEHSFEPFRPDLSTGPWKHALGFVQPYSDSPLDDEAVSENIYMNILHKAERYVYITTPYLIIDNEMLSALSVAAKCGVDVRIITPHIADKWYVHAVTRHSYAKLLESGVRIFEYTPGFIHAKSFVSDDVYGVVGTVNLDYRSLYLHFECGVWMYRTASIAQILQDFRSTEKLSQEVTLEQMRAAPFLVRLGRSVLSVFSPLM